MSMYSVDLRNQSDWKLIYQCLSFDSGEYLLTERNACQETHHAHSELNFCSIRLNIKQTFSWRSFTGFDSPIPILVLIPVAEIPLLILLSLMLVCKELVI